MLEVRILFVFILSNIIHAIDCSKGFSPIWLNPTFKVLTQLWKPGDTKCSLFFKHVNEKTLEAVSTPISISCSWRSACPCAYDACSSLLPSSRRPAWHSSLFCLGSLWMYPQWTDKLESEWLVYTLVCQCRTHFACLCVFCEINKKINSPGVIHLVDSATQMAVV